MKPWIVIALAIGCDSGARPTPPAPAPTPPPAPVVPTPIVTPAIDAGIDLAKVEWPSGVEFTMARRDVTISPVFYIAAEYPQFGTKPPMLGVEINKNFGAPTAADGYGKNLNGAFTQQCDVSLVNRLAVVVRCKSMLDARTLKEAAEGTGGAPDGETPTLFARWLQPGLPPITIDQLAPGVDVAKLIAQAKDAAPSGCECPLDPDTFVIDSGGVTFVSTQYCSSDCSKSLPKIPLDELKPTHPWAVKLVAWIRKRVEAGEDLVKNDGASR